MTTENFKNMVGAYPCGRPITNFSIRVFTMAIIIGLLLISCGGRGGNQQSGTVPPETKTEQATTGGTTLKDLNDSNWQTVIKSNFGLDIAVPFGWIFRSVTSPNGVNNLILKMTIGEGTTGEAEGKRLFAATKAISPHGNYKNNPNWEAEKVSAGDVVNDISEVDRFTDSDVLASWSFSFNSKMIMVNFSAMGNQAEYMFTINNR